MARPRNAPEKAEPVFRFRLRDDVEGQVGSFMAGPQAVELDEEHSTFETRDRDIAVGLREIPFLEEVSE